MPCHSQIETLRSNRRKIARDMVRLVESLVFHNSDVPGGEPKVRAALTGTKLADAKSLVRAFNEANAEIKRRKRGSY